MKVSVNSKSGQGWVLCKAIYLTLLLLLSQVTFLIAQTPNGADFIEYTGTVVDSESNKKISEVHITLINSKIGSLSNAEGEFSLKIPNDKKPEVQFSKVGYKSVDMTLDMANPNSVRVTMEPRILNLKTIDVYQGGNARRLVEKVLGNKGKRQDKLTGFYREKIKRGAQRNVMLAEAVLQIDERKSTFGKRGRIELYKSRKNTDYKRLDTIAVKLRGGPYNPLYIDATRYPEYLFYAGTLDNFKFEFGEPTTINNRFVHVVLFEEVNKKEPYYHGKLFIDGESTSLIKLDYSLNVDNKREARRILVAHKPKYAKVTPIETRYSADYVLKDGKWYYSYGHFSITVKVNWRKKLFNKRYTIDSEMVVTDRNPESAFPENELIKIKPTVVMADDIKGFGDPNFWGPNNIIEPETSIQRTIESIRKKLDSQ